MKKILTPLFVLLASTAFAQKNSTTTDALAINTPDFSFNTYTPEDYTPYAPPHGRNCVNGLRVVANVFAFSGGALVGWTLGSAVAGGEPEWYLAGIGAGLIAIGIPLDIIGKKRCERYSMIETAELPYYAFSSNNSSLRVSGSGNTIGLVLNF